MSELRPARRRRTGVVVLAAGFAVIVVGQLIGPVAAPPLYDGLVNIEPYRWLDPPPPGQPGGAKGATGTVAVKGGVSPLIAIATPEQPPQAQVFAPPSSFTLPPGTTSLSLSIQPIPTEGAPADGHISGNVYRILIADQNGTPVTAPASALVSVVMRGHGAIADGTIEQFVDGSWKPLKSSPAGFASTFLAVVTSFGDFAVVAPGPGPSSVASAAPAASPPATPAASGPATSSTGPGTAAPVTPVPTGGSSSGDSNGGSTPIVPIAIAVVILGGIVVVLANRRRPPPPPPTRYQGARRR
ncbi:MAG: hypothetical protein ACHQ3P_00310 [Candidatus Limnocylindrales bacterium]